MAAISFKQRVLSVIIDAAREYKSVFVDYEYLIYSKGFLGNAYYTIKAKEGNFKHLTGVTSALSPYAFFMKCFNKTLTEADFDFIVPRKTERFVKGVVRNKIIALPLLATMFNQHLIATESFVKGNVACSLATTDSRITVGFEDRINARPKTLLRGNALLNAKTRIVDVDLILCRKQGSNKFDIIVQGDVREFCERFPQIVLCDLVQCRKFSGKCWQ